jgi:hypothetical protein
MSRPSPNEYDLMAFEVEVAAECEAEEKAGRPTRRSVEGRRLREKKIIHDVDGRKRTRKDKMAERDRVQLNATVRGYIKEALVQTARQHNRSMVDILETALEEYMMKIGSKPAKAARHA